MRQPETNISQNLVLARTTASEQAKDLKYDFETKTFQMMSSLDSDNNLGMRRRYEIYKFHNSGKLPWQQCGIPAEYCIRIELRDKEWSAHQPFLVASGARISAASTAKGYRIADQVEHDFTPK